MVEIKVVVSSVVVVGGVVEGGSVIRVLVVSASG